MRSDLILLRVIKMVLRKWRWHDFGTQSLNIRMFRAFVLMAKNLDIIVRGTKFESFCHQL